MSRTIWFSAGELSGDMQAAGLLRALRVLEPGIQAAGMGGPNLAGAGQRNLFRVEDLSVMGITEVFSVLPRALRLLKRIRIELEKLRPAAVVLVDAPEFNFRVARIANELNIPVYYFIPPKVWAWRTGRVNFLREHVQKLFCILPFEPDFYRAHGMDVDYVGNPLIDMVNRPCLESIAPEAGRIGVMPGSRSKEVRLLMPLFGEAAKRLLTLFPELTFHCLRAPNMDAGLLRSLWPAEVPLSMEEPDERYMQMRRCSAIMAASGTATLETALVGTPTVIAYKVSPLSYEIGKRLVKIKWIGLPNLILDREVFPECIQKEANPEKIVTILKEWLGIPTALDTVRAGLDEVARRCGEGDSAMRTAELLLAALNGREN